MPSRTVYAGTATTGGTHLASHDNSYSGGWYGRATATATQTSIGAAEVDLTSLSITVTANSNRLIKITGHCPAVENSVVDGRFILRIYESTTLLGEAITLIGRTGASFGSVTAYAFLTPSSGSHTYKLRGISDQGGSATLNNSATAVAFIEVLDLGPSS